MTAPPPSFLGLQVEPDWPSDIQYSVKLLASRDVRAFFKGVNLLVAIHAFNASPLKRALAERVLDLLCKVLPSYVKKNEAQDHYDINKTRMDEAIDANTHPLDLSRTLARKEHLVPVPASAVVQRSKEGASDDGITILSIEEPGAGRNSLVDQIKLDMVAPVEGHAGSCWTNHESVDARTPGPGAGAGIPVESQDGPDEWIDAGQARGTVEKEFLFDAQGEVTGMLEEGLTLINPVEREFEADQNYSSAGGYQDPYQQQFPAGGSGSPGLKPTRVSASSVAGQRCELSDGILDASDGHAIVCPACKAAFHETCASLVMDYQGQACPGCGKQWAR